MTTLVTRKLNPRKITTKWARLLAPSRWVSTWFLRSGNTSLPRFRNPVILRGCRCRNIFWTIDFGKAPRACVFLPLNMRELYWLYRLCVWNLPNSWCITYVDFQDVNCYHGKIASQLASHHPTYKILTPQRLSLKRPSRDGKMPSLATAIGGGLSIGILPLLFV